MIAFLLVLFNFDFNELISIKNDSGD